MKSEKNIYVVLGMARSGTSAIARGLAALGVHFGENLEPANSLWNPKGFWEDMDIVYKVNRGVMFAIDYQWMNTGKIDALLQDNADLTNLKHYAYDLLKQRTDVSNHFGFKDPRTAKLLPFWQEVFNQLQVQDHYVITVRNPLASAYSYQRVTGADIEVGILLWIMHLLPALESTHDKNRLLVSYDLMLKHPREQLARIKNQLKIPVLASDAEVENYANQFLDKKLQHYEYSLDDLRQHPATAVAPVCVKMYDLLLRVAQDEVDLSSLTFVNEWRAIKEEIVAAYPTFQYIDALLRRNKQSERTLRTIKKSLPWKLASPLRALDNALRSARVKSRHQRRLLANYGK